MEVRSVNRLLLLPLVLLGVRPYGELTVPWLTRSCLGPFLVFFPAPPPLALAAPAPPTGTPPRGPRIRPFGSPSRLPGGAAPAGHPPGKICFVHGFQRLHSSRSCPTMEADPGNYTVAQRSLVHFPAGSSPVIDGKMCSLTCAPGVGPHP